jgi:flagellar hook protein FlgE
MSSALTELIIFQRSYDANAKIVTTTDQMIQKALQM